MAQDGFIDAEGARLYFQHEGRGPAVLFIHAGVADLRMWDSQVDALKSSFKCIRFDMRSFGRTENSAETFSPSPDIAAVLDHVGVDKAHLVGCSMGGAFAIDFALEFGGRVESLMLVAAGVGGWDGPPNEAEMAEMAEVEKAYEAKDWDRTAELEVAYWLDGPGRNGRVQGEVREKMLLMCRGAYDRGEPDPRVTPLDPPAIGRLSEIDVPTQVSVGTFDESSIIEIADLLAAGIRGANKAVYEGAAHMLNLEFPDRFNAELETFLTEQR
jgi:3-oxoadipate enol-lactonase